jgi:hypothetical protein
MLMKSKYLKGVTRYKSINADAKGPRFIAVYKYDSFKDFEEFDKSPELAAGLKEMGETWGNRVDLLSREQYELINDF